MRLIIALALLFAAHTATAQSFKVATFNVRYDSPRDSGNLWRDRSGIVANLIRYHDFDIFGTQEALPNQLKDMEDSLPGYQRYGVGRDDGKEGGEHSAIFFRKSSFKLLNKGDFWLSETPEKPSLGWDAICCNRICSWVYLQDKKSGKKFFVFNAHFDHQGVKARVESSKLVLQKIRSIAGNQPAIFTGDLNGNHQSDWYQELAKSDLLADTYKTSGTRYINNGSFNAFKGAKSMDVIDHIFATQHFSASKWAVLTDTYFGKFPSDHFPVTALLQFSK